MGRPKKQNDVKQRTVYVYVPKKELVGEWKVAAKKAGVSVSGFVQEAMEYLTDWHQSLVGEEPF